MLENPFAILRIEVGATLAQVQAAYRKLAKDCHPDRQPDNPEAAAKFRAITEARYTILEMKGRGGSARRSGIDTPGQESLEGVGAGLHGSVVDHRWLSQATRIVTATRTCPW